MATREQEKGGGGGGQFCPKCAMVRAIDHAISVVRPVERIGFLGVVHVDWTLTIPEVRVMTPSRLCPMQKHSSYAKTHTHTETQRHMIPHTSLTVTSLLPFLFMVEDT